MTSTKIYTTEYGTFLDIYTQNADKTLSIGTLRFDFPSEAQAHAAYYATA